MTITKINTASSPLETADKINEIINIIPEVRSRYAPPLSDGINLPVNSSAVWEALCTPITFWSFGNITSNTIELEFGKKYLKIIDSNDAVTFLLPPIPSNGTFNEITIMLQMKSVATVNFLRNSSSAYQNMLQFNSFDGNTLDLSSTGLYILKIISWNPDYPNSGGTPNFLCESKKYAYTWS